MSKLSVISMITAEDINLTLILRTIIAECSTPATGIPRCIKFQVSPPPPKL